jgi:FkbM family methyltransferase
VNVPSVRAKSAAHWREEHRLRVRHKLNRIQRWSETVGMLEALRFELAWTSALVHVDVKVPGYEQPFVLRRSSSDISVFETVFIDREFDLQLPRAPKLVIDGGANVGLSTAYLANRYPHAKIIAIEPSTSNLVQFRINCAQFNNVDIVEGGLWPSSGFLRIVNPDDPPWAFRCELAHANAPDVFPGHSIESIIARSGFDSCDLLKLDVEGAEEWLFAEPSAWLSRVQVMLIEVHSVAARKAVLEACPEQRWTRDVLGEKVLLVARD